MSQSLIKSAYIILNNNKFQNYPLKTKQNFPQSDNKNVKQPSDKTVSIGDIKYLVIFTEVDQMFMS